MRSPPLRAAALAVLLAAGATAVRAAPFAVLDFSAREGLSIVDAASVTRVGAYPHAWAYVVLPDRPPQRVFLESSEVAFDCAGRRLQVVTTVRYDDKDHPLARSVKTAAWERVTPKTPGAAMHRQVCAGAFDPATLRGAGQTVFDYARAMRPLLSRLKD